MNILIFNYSFFAKSQTFVYQQTIGLSKNHNVTLLGFSFENEDLFPTPVKKYKIPFFKNILDRIASSIYRKITGVYNSISVLTKYDVEYILRSENIDVIHAHFGPVALLILPIARKLNIPLCVTFHGIDASHAFLKDKRYESAIRDLFTYANKIIIVSPHMRESLKLEEQAVHYSIIPCCVDVDYFTRRPRVLNLDNNTVKLIHSGRLTAKKGVPALIKVFLKLCEKFENIQLTVIGEGDEFSVCQAMISGHKHRDKIFLLGAKSQAEVKEAMESSDIFVLNSRTDDSGDMEGSPVSILEAMALELPVISTIHAGIPYVIESGKNGILVPEMDDAALYEACSHLITNSDMRDEYGKMGRKTVISSFTSEQMIDKIEYVLKTIHK